MAQAFPLLVTATFDVGDVYGVTLRDPRQRVVRHLEGLLVWFRDSWVTEIVLVKNCSLPICLDSLVAVAEAHGKRLEFVQVEQSPLTRKRGKGYGEGDMIRQALIESETLKRADGFCKATGKLYLRDAGSFFGMDGGAIFFKSPAPQSGALLFWRKLLTGCYRSTCFHRIPPLLYRCARIPWSLVAAAPSEWIDTRFYRVTKEIYANRFLDSYKRVDDALGYSLEAAFADDLRGLKNSILVNSTPIVFGYSGTHGTAAAEFPQEVTNEAAELAPKILRVSG